MMKIKQYHYPPLNSENGFYQRIVTGAPKDKEWGKIMQAIKDQKRAKGKSTSIIVIFKLVSEWTENGTIYSIYSSETEIWETITNEEYMKQFTQHSWEQVSSKENQFVMYQRTEVKIIRESI